ncbi:MAG TPA: response regulator [Bryobacteraceae bacterium]|jgi:CheY-like chemotaxis protein
MARVRLIEDDESQLEVRKLILEQAGHTVVFTGKADAVVMDLHIPSLEAGLAQIRELSQAGARICVLSGLVDDLKGRPEEKLVEKILRKPARTEILLRWLAAMLILAGLAQAETLPLNVDKAGEVALALELSSPGSDWSKEGREAALADVSIDGGAAQQVMVFDGERPHKYPLWIGKLAAGSHEVRVTRNAQYSAAGSQLKVLGVRRIDVADDVLAHAPVLYARKNTIGKFTDIPLIVYAEHLDEGKTLQYTVIFSNEDGGTATRALMARWGRTTDIEYVYRLDVAANRAIIQGNGHKDIAYTGAMEGSHPILIPTTDNNMVGAGETSEIRYQIVPIAVDLTHDSRESVMDRFPWSYRIAAEEMEREGKMGLIGDPRGYLLVETPITNHDSAVAAVARLKSNGRIYSSNIGREPMAMERDAIVRTTIQLPEGTLPSDVESIGVTCIALTRRPPTPKAGPCSFGPVVKVFHLDHDYKPVRIPGAWDHAEPTQLNTGETVLLKR